MKIDKIANGDLNGVRQDDFYEGQGHRYRVTRQQIKDCKTFSLQYLGGLDYMTMIIKANCTLPNRQMQNGG